MNNTKALSRYWPIAAGLLLAYAAVSAWQSPAPVSQNPGSGFEYPATKKQAFNVRHVSVLEAKDLIDKGALVLDVRYQAVGTAIRIADAMVMPIDKLQERMGEIADAKTRPIIVYCGNGSTLGPEAAEMLAQAGFTEVVNLREGLEGWKAAGLPTKSS